MPQAKEEEIWKKWGVNWDSLDGQKQKKNNVRCNKKQDLLGMWFGKKPIFGGAKPILQVPCWDSGGWLKLVYIATWFKSKIRV